MELKCKASVGDLDAERHAYLRGPLSFTTSPFSSVTTSGPKAFRFCSLRYRMAVRSRAPMPTGGGYRSAGVFFQASAARPGGKFRTGLAARLDDSRDRASRRRSRSASSSPTCPGLGAPHLSRGRSGACAVRLFRVAGRRVTSWMLDMLTGTKNVVA